MLDDIGLKMNHLRENWGSTYVLYCRKNSRKYRLKWSEHLERRLVNVVVNQMKESRIKRDSENFIKTIRETITKDLAISELDSNVVYNRTLLRNFIYVVNPI